MTPENVPSVYNPPEHKSVLGYECDKAGTFDEQNPVPTGRKENMDDSLNDDVHYRVPCDHGWAWVVCAGCFVITYIMSQYDLVLAITFVDIDDRFDVSVTTAAVVFTIYSFTFSAGSVVSTNIIVPKFGDRKVIVIAAIINSISSIIIAFIPGISLYLTFHLLKGLSIGSMWIPALGLLGHYFKRRRSFASTITNSGIGVSLLITPILVRTLLDNFGFRGAMLIISGIEMQAIAIGMLLRPPSMYIRNVRNTSFDLKHSQRSTSQKELYSLLDHNVKQCDIGKSAALTDITISDDKQYLNVNIPPLDNQLKLNSTSQNYEGAKASQKDQNLHILARERVDDYLENTEKVQHEIATSSLGNPVKQDLSLLQSSSHSQEDQFCEITNRDISNTSDIKLLHSEAETKCFNHELQEKSSFQTHTPRSFWRLFYEALSKIFDFSLLNDRLVLIMLASTAFGALIMYIPTYIPKLADMRGVSKTNAAMLLTVCGGVNLLSSVVQGLFLDCRFITAAKFIVICQFIVGTMCHLTHFFTSFPTLLFLSVTHGMFGGARMSLMPVVAMDFVGVANLSKALGFNAMVATLSLSIHHPFLGYILEVTDSFAIPFHYVGLALYLSAGLLLLENFGRKLNAKREIPEKRS